MRLARAALIRQADASGLALTCRRCGLWIDTTLSGMDPMGLTVGHVRAVRLGGTDDASNLAAEHRRCNLAAKAAASPRALIARPVRVIL